MEGTGGSKEEEGSSQVAIFQPVSHPVLKSVDPKKVAAFLKDRARYEDEVCEKQKEVPSMTVASYKISVDKTLIENMHFIGAFDTIAPGVAVNHLTSEHIENYVRSLVKRDEGDDINPAVINAALRGVKVPMSVEDPKARMWEYVNDVFSRLDGVGYGTFKADNPEKTVKILQTHLFPANLKEAMAQHIEFQGGLKKDLKKYIRVLCKEAVVQDKLQSSSKARSFGEPSKSFVKDTGKKSQSSGSGAEKKPLSLNLKCAAKGLRHYVRTDCKETSAEQAEKLIKDHLDKKRKAKSLKNSNANKAGAAIKNSTLLMATFAGSVTRETCADSGSDTNLMPSDLLAELLAKGADVQVKRLETPQKFGLAVVLSDSKKELSVTIDRVATMTTELQVRHGKSLTIRNLKWDVTKESMEQPLLGLPLLEALGLDTQEILVAACDRLGANVDANDLMRAEDYSPGSVARALNSGVFHSDRASSDDIDEVQGSDFLDEEKWLDLGEDTTEEMNDALESMVEAAVENGLSNKGVERLRGLVKTYRDVFRVRLGRDPPADVAPMKVSLAPDCVPHVAKARRYTPDQREFMARYTDKLLEYGFIRENADAAWAAAPLLVTKAPPANFRLTFDLRRVNAATVPVAWPMPHIESELLSIAGSKCFATIDFCSGYWQLPLEVESQEAHSFMTPSGTYSPTRTLQGATNSGANFQSRVEPCFKAIREYLLAWLDDFLLHDKTEEGLLDTLEEFLRVCEEKLLKISARKSVLFTRSVRWCGRTIDEEGVRCDPQRLSGLLNAHAPVSAAELCQYVHCLQWMSGSIPDFAARIAPFRDMLEDAYAKSGSRKKRSIQGISLISLGWNVTHEELYESMQAQLRDAVSLAHRDSSKVICVFTDASDEHWAAVVTQCEPEELSKSDLDQTHSPLAFLSGTFTDTESRWSTFEKEAYAIYQVFCKLDYMLAAERDIHVFSDHRNLLFVYNPLAVEPALGRHIVTKVQRWALFLSRFMYTIEHIPGEKNIMADIMTRWFAGYRGKRKARRLTSCLLTNDIVQSPNDDDFSWPSVLLIIKEQGKHEKDRPQESYKGKDGCYINKGKIWIPDRAIELQVKLLVVAHCGSAGHRGSETTNSALAEMFKWTTMEEDCSEFVRSCIHCLTSKGGARVPRPLSMTFHASKPNEILHFDYIYMGAGCRGFKYLLVLKDDLSSYLWLCPSAAATAENAASEIARWIRVFTAMPYWVSDQGSHFKNEVMGILAQDYNVQHKFTVAYSPWVNGTVESCMRSILAACRSLQSEWKLGPQDWPTVSGVVMSALNSAPLKRLGKNGDGAYRCPLEVMTGLKPSRTMLKPGIHLPTSGARSIEQTRILQLIEINKLQGSFDSMHKAVADKVSKNREKHIRNHNKKTNLQGRSFEVGDLLWSETLKTKGIR